MKAQSEVPTPYGVFCVETFDVGKGPCNGGKIIYLTKEAYGAQMDMPDARWKCPLCGGEARWSDENFEEFGQSNCEHVNEREITGGWLECDNCGRTVPV